MNQRISGYPFFRQTHMTSGWWFGTGILFFHMFGMLSSQLTFSYLFQRGRLNYQPVYIKKIYIYITWQVVKGNLETKVPTIWTDEKQHSQKEAEPGRNSDVEKVRREGRRQEMEKVRREKMQVREKVGKSRNTVFFQCFVAPEGRKIGSLKRRVRRHLGRWEIKNCTPL